MAVADNIKRFDELDFEAFSKQNWKLFNEIHAPDVEVIFPDGHRTKGIAKHDEDMKAMFAYAPDLKVVDHPVNCGSGDWTATIGQMIGTFSKPMATLDGKSIPPTGKKFSLPMATIARWKNGRYRGRVPVLGQLGNDEADGARVVPRTIGPSSSRPTPGGRRSLRAESCGCGAQPTGALRMRPIRS